MNTINSVLGGNEEGPSTIGLEVGIKAVDATEVFTQSDRTNSKIYHA